MLQLDQVAATELQMVNQPEVTEDFVEWMLNEVICNSDDSDADIHEGGYEEPRAAPTREPSSGWPDNTPQSIREAAAAITNPELKVHSDKVQENLEEMQQKFGCMTCKDEVETQMTYTYAALAKLVNARLVWLNIGL